MVRCRALIARQARGAHLQCSRRGLHCRRGVITQYDFELCWQHNRLWGSGRLSIGPEQPPLPLVARAAVG